MADIGKPITVSTTHGDFVVRAVESHIFEPVIYSLHVNSIAVDMDERPFVMKAKLWQMPRPSLRYQPISRFNVAQSPLIDAGRNRAFGDVSFADGKIEVHLEGYDARGANLSSNPAEFERWTTNFTKLVSSFLKRNPGVAGHLDDAILTMQDRIFQANADTTRQKIAALETTLAGYEAALAEGEMPAPGM